MTVTVKLFALGKELIGKDELSIDLPEKAVIRDLIDMLKREYHRFAELNTFLVAVNMEYAEQEAALADGDEVAIIPPVSGG